LSRRLVAATRTSPHQLRHPRLGWHSSAKDYLRATLGAHHRVAQEAVTALKPVGNASHIRSPS
jgi:hypothetical protein